MPESAPPRVLVTGAAGNLGSRLARRLAAAPVRVRLMVHRTPPPEDVAAAPNAEVVRADLGRPETLPAAVAGVDSIVHFAGVLFRPRPERFLPVTNTDWFGNLVDAAVAAGVRRVVLISFPHVEGPTTPERPATGRMDADPISVHARTRLAAERLLFARARGTGTTPVVLRAGTVYGRGILMVEAARRLARRRLLGVWPDPTWYHFIQTEDFLSAAEAAALRDGVHGVYLAGDEQPLTLQAFLDEATRLWGLPRPWRMPFPLIHAVAGACEAFAALFGTISPLTRDFVTLGRVPHVCDTTRMRRDLVPRLAWPTFEQGKGTLV